MSIAKIDLNELAQQLHAAAVEKGFWDVENALEKHCAKMISELGEVVQADRAGIMYQPEDSLSGKPEGVAAELADFVMMMLDFCAEIDVDINGLLGPVDDEVYRNTVRQDLERTTIPRLVLNLDYAMNAVMEANDMVSFGGSLIHAFMSVPFWLEMRGYDLWEIIRLKMEYNNRSRPKLHGRAY